MQDSFYNILEQQQKIADLYNRIYTPELLKMQQTYSDMITRLQPSITVALQNMAKMSNLVEKSIRSFDTDKFLNVYNRTMEIDRILTQSMRSILQNIDIERITSLAQQVTLSTEVIENFSRTLSLMQSESIISNLAATIQSMPDSVWDTISDEEGYSKEEIQEELEVMQAEGFQVTDIEGLTPEQVKENVWVWLWESYPKVAAVLLVLAFIIGGTFDVLDKVDIANNILLPMVQNSIVKMQGNEDIFFVKVESARLYTEPSSHSEVITKILYAEQVMQIESVNLWDKVIYINSDGEEVEGWMAKRNLMTYQDYEFNSDDLYNIQ